MNMAESVTMEFDSRPSVVASYLKALVYRRKGLKFGENLPEISAVWKNIEIEKSLLKRYLEACELPDDGYVPVLYPHVLASPVYMKMLTHKKFPIPLIGSLHLRNHIIEHRKIGTDEKIDMNLKIYGKRIVKQGLEFDFTIVITSGGEKVWESITTWLKQGKFGDNFESSPNSDIIKPVENTERFADLYIPGNIGKKFASITGDYNPIHVSKVLAPLFGLKRDVAHAMWACANSLAKLPGLPDDKPKRIDFAFKGPLFLDNRSYVDYKKQKNGFRFDYYIEGNDRPCINGRAVTVESGVKLVK